MPTTVLIPEARPEYIDSKWLMTIRGQKAAGAIITANEFRLLPFYVARPIKASHIGCRVTVAVTSGNARLAIFANNPLINKPTGAALAYTGNISTTGVGVKDEDDNTAIVGGSAVSGGEVTLNEGWYWGAVIVDTTAAPTATFQTLSAAESHMSFYMGADTAIGVSASGTISALFLGYANPGAFGTWPDVTGVTFTELTTQASAHIILKVSDVP